MGTRTLIRKEAKQKGLKTYSGGKKCIKHPESLRFTSTGACIQCSYTRRKNYGIENKSVLAERRRKHSLENKEELNLKTKLWHKKNPLKSMYGAAKSRANRLGIPFNITEEDLKIPEKCPVLGIPLLGKTDRGVKRSDNTPSLDKIIPALGYVKGNVAIISWRANRLKNDGTIDEIRKILNYMEETRMKIYKEPLYDEVY